MEKDIHKGKGYGFQVDDGMVYMVRCFECGKENWAPAVASGRCAWCGHNANLDDMIGEINVIIRDSEVHLEVGIDVPPGEKPLMVTIKGKYDQVLVLSQLNEMLMTEGYNPKIHLIEPDIKKPWGWTNVIKGRQK